MPNALFYINLHYDEIFFIIYQVYHHLILQFISITFHDFILFVNKLFQIQLWLLDHWHQFEFLFHHRLNLKLFLIHLVWVLFILCLFRRFFIHFHYFIFQDFLLFSPIRVYFFLIINHLLINFINYLNFHLYYLVFY